MRFLGLIPARGGSKSVPRKNIKPLGGLPLIAHTILEAGKARALERVIVSTDDAEIAAVARHWGAEVPFLRPAELAQDDTPDMPVFQHALEWLARQEGWRPDALVNLRPTSPLRRARHIKEACELFARSGGDLLKSVCPVGHYHPHKMWTIEGARMLPYRPSELWWERGADVPRQALEKVFWQNGVVDIHRAGSILSPKPPRETIYVPYRMEARYSVDLDSEEDFLLAEFLLGRLADEKEGGHGTD